MDEVSYLKFSHHAELRALLFRTYPAVFFVQLPVTDPFWRDGAGIGMNDSELGRSLMRVREQLCVDVPIVVKRRSYPLRLSYGCLLKLIPLTTVIHAVCMDLLFSFVR